MSYAFRLEFPVSTNTMWVRGPRGMYLSKRGRQFKVETAAALGEQFPHAAPLTGRLGVQIELAGRTKREYDIDNYAKSLLDAIKGIVFVDDSQVDELIVRRLPVAPPGYADVIVSELAPSSPVEREA